MYPTRCRGQEKVPELMGGCRYHHSCFRDALGLLGSAGAQNRMGWMI